MTDTTSAPHDTPDDPPEGPVSAAIIAGGLGATALGALTTLAEANADAKEWLQWDDGVGPLAGKTGMAVIIWLVSWVVLHLVYRHKAFESRKALSIGLLLVAVGVLGTFPTFFQAFAPE